MIRYEVGDTRAVVAGLPDASVSLVASSPPFIALRSYLPADHEHKHAEIGSEPDPATFLDTLLELTAEWGRVLAPWGSIAIELGDTYSGSGGAGGDYNKGGLRDGQGRAAGSAKFERHAGRNAWEAAHPIPFDATTSGRGMGGPGWPRAKSLALIPQLYATSLAYGRNLLTGQPSPAGQWLVRNVIVWHRPNPAVGALGDKVRPSTSYITVATRSPKRWFDLDAVRTVGTEPGKVKTHAKNLSAANPSTGWTSDSTLIAQNAAGAPPLDCWFDEHDTWTLTTQPSSLAHYAMWPARLAERLILMMCPAEVCAACGTPRRRLTHVDGLRGVDILGKTNDRATGLHGDRQPMPVITRTTLGWSDCGHDAYVPGTVLDPFAGTGTTLAVADLHHRDAIGIDLDERNRDLYPRRRDECARALFDVRPQMTGQLDMFGEVLL